MIVKTPNRIVTKSMGKKRYGFVESEISAAPISAVAYAAIPAAIAIAAPGPGICGTFIQTIFSQMRFMYSDAQNEVVCVYVRTDVGHDQHVGDHQPYMRTKPFYLCKTYWKTKSGEFSWRKNFQSVLSFMKIGVNFTR